MKLVLALAAHISVVNAFAPQSPGQSTGYGRVVSKAESAAAPPTPKPKPPPAPSADAKAYSELVALQEGMPGPPGFWDPLELAQQEFSLGIADNEQDRTQAETIGWLRHAEIKHGRVAMAGFLGFIAQCTPLVSGEHAVAPYRDYVAGVTPQEQWDNIPLYGKLQIIIFVGMLESYGEGAGNPEGYVHYMKGGKPGFFPKIAGRGGPGVDGGQGRHFLLNLWDPLNLRVTEKRTPQQNARGRAAEINNGRLAMFGIMGLLAESRVPGSVPFISQLAGANFPHYDGDVMAPFSADFTLSLTG
jgi:hypothetical protein